MICQVCRHEKKLIKAHIIPEGFFRPLRSKRKAPELYTNTKGIYTKRVPKGIYDREILCADCDGIFSPWENHAHKVLIQNFSEELAIFWNGQKIAYNITDFDYKLFKLFFISLLWRASISKNIFYRRISAGPFEQILKDMILSFDPGPPQKFAVTLAKFSDPNITVMMDPHPEKFNDINYCRFYLTGFMAYIKVDDRPVPDLMSDFYLRPEDFGNHLWLILSWFCLDL